jgi:hypothetical protein
VEAWHPAGFSASSEWPTKNAYQNALKVVAGKTVSAIVLAKFKPVPADRGAGAK